MKSCCFLSIARKIVFILKIEGDDGHSKHSKSSGDHIPFNPTDCQFFQLAFGAFTLPFIVLNTSKIVEPKKTAKKGYASVSNHL